MRLPNTLDEFSAIWFVDFEFAAPPGERPLPVCMVAREFKTGRVVRLWQNALLRQRHPPFSIDQNTLFVAFFSSAELTCFLALGWPLPVFVLDLYVEFRNATNGLTLPCGRGLLGALVWYQLDAIGAEEKEEMRALAMRASGGWNEAERKALLEYCQSDVDALGRLLSRMIAARHLDLPHALLRGRYMKAVAHMEHNGIPLDVPMLNRLKGSWSALQTALIADADVYGVYEGTTFKSGRWARVVAEHHLPWPRTQLGALSLSDDTFKEMARKYPIVQPYREIRSTLAKLRLNNLAVGSDGRNRCLLSPFGATSGRNTPSNSKFIFGPSAWVRGLIKPAPGRAVAYLDYSQQEFGIAAALSADRAMLAAYQSGDVYLAFAKQAHAVPADATKESHKAIRDLFKQCALATLYGQEAASLALRINRSEVEARALLQLHRQMYTQFWRWSEGAEAHALLMEELYTVFGWKLRMERGTRPKPRTFRNFPMQANGAVMLRLACSLATERGVQVCAPIHDALLIEASLEDLDHAILVTQAAMAEASAAVLNGFLIRSDVKIVRYPHRYEDEDGVALWDTVQRFLARPKGNKSTI